jgi:hypothetical protein
MRLFIGVDLGLKGAIVVLSEAGAHQVIPMPTVRATKGREVYDIPYLVDVFRRRKLDDPLVIAEQLHAMPFEKGGSNANFQRGRALGILEGILGALAIRYELVTPQSWQKVMHQGASGADTKQRSIVIAKRFFPEVSLRRSERCRKDDDGIADALLLADYARRRYAGQALGGAA